MVGAYLVKGGNLVASNCDKFGPPPKKFSIAPFYMDRTEVTKACYEACVQQGSCSEPVNDIQDPNSLDWKDPSRAREPVGGTTFNQSEVFCSWRGGRLPTIAELVYAHVGSDAKFAQEELAQKMIKCVLEKSDNCKVVLDQGKLLYPNGFDTNVRLFDAGTWSTLDVGPQGIQDVFGGVPERTSSLVSDLVCGTTNPDPSRHLVVSLAGSLRGVHFPGENGFQFGYVSHLSREDDLDVSYSLGFRCVYPIPLEK
jgi:formylglycine-generating enzyme required for sulfatase activity